MTTVSKTHYLVICVFPEVQSYELKGRQHGPAKMIKPNIAKSRVFSDVFQAGVTAGTYSGKVENKKFSHTILCITVNQLTDKQNVLPINGTR